MKNYRALLNNLLQDESGQDLIEYALVAAGIGLAAVTAMTALSGDISSAFGRIGTALSGTTA